MSTIDKKKFVISGLRRMTYRWPPRYMTQSAARVERGKYKCNECQGVFPKKETSLDHVEPVVDPEKGWQGWDSYIERMFADQPGWQVLCDSCHDKKTSKENSSRKKVKKKAAKRKSKKRS